MEGYSDLSCSITIKPHNKMTGRATVWGAGSQDIAASIQPKIYKTLSASVDIAKVWTSDFKGSLILYAVNSANLQGTIEPVVYNTLPASIYIKPKNRMTGKVTVLGVGGDSLEGSISPVIHSWLPSSIESRVHGYIDLSGSLTPSFPNYSHLRGSIEPRIGRSLQCSLTVKPTNRMSGTVSVIEPPYEITELLPVQDATVREKVPTLNYGTEEQLAVGASYNDTLRSLLKFNVAPLPEFHTIRNVYLELDHAISVNSEQSVELWQLTQPWGEYSTTWANQPPMSKLLTTFNVEPGTDKTLVDITEIYRDWLESGGGEGFILKQSSELGSITYFYSRESFAPPKILVEHYDSRLLFSLGRGSMPGDLHVRAIRSSDLLSSVVVSSYGEETDLAASINVPEYFGEKNLMGSISAREPNGVVDFPASIKSRIMGYTSLQGSLTVSQIADLHGYLDIKNPNLLGDLVVSQSNNTDLSCSINVWRVSDLESNIVVVRNEESDLIGSITTCKYGEGLLEGSITCRSYWYKSLLTGSLEVIQSKHRDLLGNLIVSRDDFSDLSGSLYVRGRDYLPGSLYARAVDETVLTGSISVRVGGQDSLTSSIYVKDRADLLSKLIVSKNAYVDLVSGLEVRLSDSTGFIGDYYVRHHDDLQGYVFAINFVNSDLFGSVAPRFSASQGLGCSITAMEHRNLDASIAVAKETLSDLFGSVAPRFSASQDLGCSIVVIQHSNLDSSIIVAKETLSDLTGDIIPQFSGEAALTGSITAMEHESLKGSIYVVYAEYQDLQSSLVARVKFIGDLHSSIVIDSDFGPYAFIM